MPCSSCSTTSERAGADLTSLVEEARAIRGVLANLHSRYNRKVVEQAAIAGVLTPSVFDDPDKAQAAATYIARRLDALADETERGWQGNFQDGFRFERTVRGVKETAFIDHALLALGRRPQARRARRRPAGDLCPAAAAAPQRRRNPHPRPGRPVRGRHCGGPQGRHPAALQRPGRDEPDQLWETTLDTEVRTLLQVKVKEGEDADNIFAELMGDLVEPRKNFIQEHALTASVDV